MNIERKVDRMRIGILGTGNMGYAIGKGLQLAGYGITVYNRSDRNVSELKSGGAHVAESVHELAKESDLVIIAVKPKDILGVIRENCDYLEGKTVVSIAAGVSLQSLRVASENKATMARVMPNTPALISKGVYGVVSDGLDQELRESIVKLFSSIGEAYLITEEDIHGFISIAGSSPAYIFMFMEALADAGVRMGIKRADAYDIVADTLIGSAMLYKKTKEHPGALKDMVTSPKGTTIEAVRILEEKGFRTAVIEGALAAGLKSREMEAKDK
ncbi:pyrroline-5-carboxylate reductase [Youngiibacter fragilis]|nr:pyrroline-5-carboxylate reductase [Youngiibacter fragilis]